jgi:hypothetical protein
MPETAPQLRGYFYPTHMTARCPAFHQCRRCQLCRNYDPHVQQCQTCESRKDIRSPVHHCRCTIEAEGALLQIEKQMGRPMFDPNAKLGDVKVFDTAFHPEHQRLVQIIEQNGPAKEDGHK